ncbi:MAG: septal ring lytic transglycosylase RlpA family protein [Alphaproteobacteria bacterium]|nr:septal ring lytic transglycosylase RlpA family protein [Alphaproteobacteria bacterium]
MNQPSVIDEVSTVEAPVMVEPVPEVQQPVVDDKPNDVAKTNFAAMGTYKIGNPYLIDGVSYYPHEDYNYSEIGMASWYGPQFSGGKTANGEIFDETKFTAAHRTLPMPSLVRVTNLENGISMNLKVNDRGPYARDRIIDLSSAAAEV